MGFGIYTGGTTGLTDGTLVSASNKLTFPSITTVLDAHIRCGTDEYSAQIDFDDIPAALEIGFEAGGNWYWYGIGVAPFSAPTNLGPGLTDVWDVNYPIKLRQVAVPPSADDTFTTDGTVSACTALSTPTLTATANGSSQIDLSSTNISNEDGYLFEWSPNGSTGWQTVEQTAAEDTTCSHTGLDSGTQYFYRVKALGSGRYSDSGYGTDDATTTMTESSASFGPSSDGSVRYLDGGASWATCRAAATGTELYETNATTSLAASYDQSTKLVTRGFLAFDTSSLPDGAVLVSGKVKVWGDSKVGSAGTVILVNGTQEIPLTTADFDQAGTTKLSDTEPTVSGWATGAYVEFPLNAAGLAHISKTGTTKFAFRHSSDYNNSAPGADLSAATRYSEYTGTANDPVLEVTYLS